MQQGKKMPMIIIPEYYHNPVVFRGKNKGWEQGKIGSAAGIGYWAHANMAQLDFVSYMGLVQFSH